MISLQCISCIHYRMGGRCKAYPDGIPHEIFSGQVDHKQPYDGDNGIRFKSDDLVDKIEVDTGLLNKKEITVRGFHDKKGVWHPPHKRKIKDVTPKGVTEKDFLKKEPLPMTPDNVEKILSLDEMGVEGGIHRKDTSVLKLNDKSHAIYKTIKNDRIFGEVFTYKINKLIGWDIVPETTSGDFGKGNGSTQRWIEDGKDAYIDSTDPDSAKLTDRHLDDMSKIYVMDILTGNHDRSESNIIIKDDLVFAIDNEYVGSISDEGDLKLEDLYKYKTIIKVLDNSGIPDVHTKFKKHIITNMKLIISKKSEIIGCIDDNINMVENERVEGVISRKLKENLKNIEIHYDTPKKEYVEKYEDKT